MMGACSLWLAESLLEHIVVPVGTQVIDVGCGKAMSSVFLARELGVRLTALDLWIDAASNQQPEHLASDWQDGFETFHNPEWWSSLRLE